MSIYSISSSVCVEPATLYPMFVTAPHNHNNSTLLHAENVHAKINYEPNVIAKKVGRVE